MRRKIRLTESGLRKFIKKCINEEINFRTAETYGPFADVDDRARTSHLKTKKEQMDSDWLDLASSGAYPYGWGRKLRPGECDGGDYIQSQERRDNGDYPFPLPDVPMKYKFDRWDDPNWEEKRKYNRQADSRPLHRKGSLNRAMDEPSKGYLKTEGKLRNIIKKNIKKVLKEGYFSDDYEGQTFYYAEVFEIDGDAKDSKEFDNLRDACRWAKSQVEGPNAPYKGYVSEVFEIDEIGDSTETGYYYGDWS